jgi:hypothetical protein
MTYAYLQLGARRRGAQGPRGSRAR